MAEYVSRLPKAGTSEELEVLSVEKDADFQQVGELRALIARGTSHRMSHRTRRFSSPGLQRTARDIVVQNCRTEAQCDSFLTDTALNCTKLH